MKAIVREKAGKNFSTMRLMELPVPAIGPGEVKVRMATSRINPADMDLMKGFPSLKYKNPQIGGIDGAGTITALGADVTGFAVGDPVFFYRKFNDIGTWAEEVTLSARYIAKIPAHLTPYQAGTIALPLLTAYDCLIQLGARTGERILIHGAAGGVGFLAVQVAKSMDLHVIGTAGGKDVDALRAAGVDRVIDYRKESFADVLQPGDVEYVVDLIGGEVLMKSIDLKPKKIISVHFIEPHKMVNTGVELPGILKWILSLTMIRFRKHAGRNGVELIGQITGGNGALLSEAARLAGEKKFVVRNVPMITLDDIGQRGMNAADVGKGVKLD